MKGNACPCNGLSSVFYKELRLSFFSANEPLGGEPTVPDLRAFLPWPPEIKNAPWPYCMWTKFHQRSSRVVLFSVGFHHFRTSLLSSLRHINSGALRWATMRREILQQAVYTAGSFGRIKKLGGVRLLWCTALFFPVEATYL